MQRDLADQPGAEVERDAFRSEGLRHRLQVSEGEDADGDEEKFHREDGAVEVACIKGVDGG